MIRNLSLSIGLLTLAACAVGPDYERPPVETPEAYKEFGDWKPSEPLDEVDRGMWWSVYKDPMLDTLERQIDISNQNLKFAEAAYREALATVEQTNAGLFPIVTLDKSATRSGSGQHSAANKYDLSAGASWTIDVWGKIRRSLESAQAKAEASEANLAAARLSAQATLAIDYFALRAQDEAQKIYNLDVADNEKILSIAKNQYEVGIAAQSDVLAAQAQLETARALAINSQLGRAQMEHALAVLTGKPPANFTLAPRAGAGHVPILPAQIPSRLLERRPDIANAERQMAAANANIGVAVAAWYPDLTLSASYGYAAPTLDKLINATNSLWSFGPSIATTVLDFGARSAAEDVAKATYDQAVTTYRQTVLSAFQNIEDNLAAQRILAEQEKAQSAATAAAQHSEQVALNQYKEGIVPYTNVLTAQITRLSAEQASLTLLNSRLAASVSLIEALGGGWSTIPPEVPKKQGTQGGD